MRGAIVVLLLLLSARAEATIYYTSKSGNDANSCATATSTTASNQKLTMRSGVSCLSSGDTLLVHTGNYQEYIDVISSGTAWTAGNYVRVAAYGDGVVSLNPPTGRFGICFATPASMQGCASAAASTKYVEFDGINIDCSISPCNQNPVYWGVNVDHIRIKNATVRAQIGYPVELDVIIFGGGGYDEFVNLTVRGGGNTNRCGFSCAGYGFYVGTHHVLIDGCDISDVGAIGIEVYNGGGGNTDSIIIRNCYIHHISRTIDTRLFGIQLSSGDGHLVYNCVFTKLDTGLNNDSGNAAINIFHGNSVKAYHNTILDNHMWAFLLSSDGTVVGTEIKNTVMYQNTQGTIAGGTSNVTATNLTSDPLVTSAPSGDFTLTASSVGAINVGTSLAVYFASQGLPYVDKAGIARPIGSGVDIGAYEYVSAVLCRPVSNSGVRLPLNTGSICHSDGSTWTLGTGTSPSIQLLKDGAVVGAGAQIVYCPSVTNGPLFALISDLHWKYWNGTVFAQRTPDADPCPATTPSGGASSGLLTKFALIK